MQPVGFEPTPPKRLRPERSALDHSAKTALLGASLAGLEPAIFPLGGGRVIHYATETAARPVGAMDSAPDF